MKISVFGLGYIGLPTATMFALSGAEVVGVDINEYAVNTINQGKIHIVEPELADAVKKVVDNKLLKATLSPENADAFLIAVPTPFKGENHEPDLSYIKSATLAIAPHLKKENIVILESTSPVGTTERMIEWFKGVRPDLIFAEENSEECDVYVAYCPERVFPGKVMQELIQNDRIVGGINKISTEKACEVYKIFVKGELLQTNSRTAEMSKLTENAFRDVNIAFANELSLICDKLNIDVWELIKLANHHPRVNILKPGAGVGGHCIAVDPWFIVNKTPDIAKIITTARNINDDKPKWIKEKVYTAVDKIVKKGINRKNIKIACLGLSFKADIDDLRESPALKITSELADEFPGNIFAVEPNIKKLPDILCKHNVKLISFEESLRSDIVVILVSHKEFIANAHLITKNQFVIDANGILSNNSI